MKKFSYLLILICLTFAGTTLVAQNDFDIRDDNAEGWLAIDLEVTNMLADNIYGLSNRGNRVPDYAEGILTRFISTDLKNGFDPGFVQIARVRVNNANGRKLTFEVLEPLNPEFFDEDPNDAKVRANLYRFYWKAGDINTK